MLNQIAAIHGTGAPAVTNSYESIATVTVGAGGSSSIDFTSIPNTYKHLQIRMGSKINNASDWVTIAMRVGNGSVDSGSNYAYHDIFGQGSSVTAQAATSQNRMYIGWASGSSYSSLGLVVLDLLDYANTNKNKTVRSLTGIDNNGSGIISLESNLWMSTSAVNTISIFPHSGTAFQQYSHFALYGIKG